MESSKKTICFYIPSLTHFAGTERSLCLVANGLSSSFHVKVLCNELTDESQAVFPFDKNVEVVSLGLTNVKRSYFSILFRSAQFLNKNKVDFFISVEMMSLVFTAPIILLLRLFYLSKIKFLAWEHFNFKTTLGKPLRQVCRRLAGYLADSIVVLTHEDQKLWKEGAYIRRKIVVINNAATYPISTRAYPHESKNILAVGRFTYQKAFDDLIDIWKKLSERDKNHEFKLQIIGDGSDKELLEKKIASLQLQDSVQLIDPTSEIHRYYEAASIYVMTSRFEGLPMVLLEAASFGIPIIAFNCLTGPSEIVKNGENGYLVEERDMDTFADRLQFLIANPDLRAAMSQSNKNLVKNFDLSHIVDKWIVVLHSL